MFGLALRLTNLAGFAVKTKNTIQVRILRNGSLVLVVAITVSNLCGGRSSKLKPPSALARFALVADPASRQLIGNALAIKKHLMIQKVSRTLKRPFGAPDPRRWGPLANVETRRSLEMPSLS